VKIDGKKVDCWVNERHCDRCGATETLSTKPIEEGETDEP